MIFKDYYKILELKTNKVSPEEIKNAYRLAVKKNHPDLNINNKLAEEKIKDINEAYRTLTNSTLKRKYDRVWNRNCASNRQKQYKEESRRTNTKFNELFSIFFGYAEKEIEVKNKKNEKAPQRGENIETFIDVDIEEVFYGLDKKISLRTTDGKIKVFTISIPAGIHNGEKIRLLGQGKLGKNGAKNGDLLIKVNIKDNDKFKIKGNDLLTDLCITPWEAVLGTEASVYSIDEEIKIKIPEGAQSGEVIKIVGKGYKDGKGSRGDLLVTINIVIPKELSEEEKNIYRKLKSISSVNI